MKQKDENVSVALEKEEYQSILRHPDFESFFRQRGINIKTVNYDECEVGYVISEGYLRKYLLALADSFLETTTMPPPPIIAEIEPPNEKEKMEDILISSCFMSPAAEDYFGNYGIKLIWNEDRTKIESIDNSKFKEKIYDLNIAYFAVEHSIGTVMPDLPNLQVVEDDN